MEPQGSVTKSSGGKKRETFVSQVDHIAEEENHKGSKQ